MGTQKNDSFEHPKYMFKLMGKKVHVTTILRSKNLLNWNYDDTSPLSIGYRSYITIIKELSGNKHSE